MFGLLWNPTLTCGEDTGPVKGSDHLVSANNPKMALQASVLQMSMVALETLVYISTYVRTYLLT